MKKIMTSAALAAALLGMAISARADIINGDFETGNLAGWTPSGTTSVTSVGTDVNTGGALQTVAYGNHSAKVGDEIAWAMGRDGPEYSSLSQDWVKTSAFDKLTFAWAAVALVPTNSYHTFENTPWFQIKVTDGTTVLFDQEYYTGSPGSIVPGWEQGIFKQYGFNGMGIWYYRPWQTFELSLAGIADGDTLSVTLTTRDCAQGGHPSYAYLDGFGSNDLPPVAGVPEPETYAMMMTGLGLIGVAARRRRR